MICRPTGSPVSAAMPLGTLIAGIPASEPGMVARSFRYIASGSSTFSPISKAVTGDAGEISTSALGEGALEVLRDQRAHLLRRAVVGVVVARPTARRCRG